MSHKNRLVVQELAPDKAGVIVSDQLRHLVNERHTLGGVYLRMLGDLGVGIHFPTPERTAFHLTGTTPDILSHADRLTSRRVTELASGSQRARDLLAGVIDVTLANVETHNPFHCTASGITIPFAAELADPDYGMHIQTLAEGHAPIFEPVEWVAPAAGFIPQQFTPLHDARTEFGSRVF